MSDEPQPQQPTEGWAPGDTEGAGDKPKRPRRTGWRRLVPTWRMVLGTFVISALLLVRLRGVRRPAGPSGATRSPGCWSARSSTPPRRGR